jgi:cellobiose phosphorylase
MRYGRFDDAAREYVIERPDTPRPWSNYIGSRLYGGVVTNHAGGYSFTRSPGEGRILRFRYNALPLDQGGRYFYLRDRDSGDAWSASWQPVGKPLDQYSATCRFGTSYAALSSEYRGIRADTVYFVPLGQSFEYWWLRVTNTGDRPRRLSVFSFCEFTSEWNLINDALNLQYVMYIAEARWETHDGRGFVSASSCGRLAADPGNFANRDQSRWWWMTQTGGTIVGRDLDREAFVGVYRGLANPQAVERGACGNTEGCSDNTCGAVQSDLDLAPGQTADVLVLLGIGRADVEGRAAAAKFATPARAAAEWDALKKHWHGLLSRVEARTPDPDLDHMVNVWNAYNALICFEWSRSCSLVYTGDGRDGFGFRDTVQDLLGAVTLIPGAVRERLELMLSGQDATGGAQSEIKPWLHRPGRMEPMPAQRYRSDDCLWFFNVVPAYLAETGDVAFLDRVIPYADAGAATVLGHLRRALEFNLERTGRNGLPCGLAADWNDCLKLGFRGESVFVAFQVRLGLRTYADLCGRLGRAKEVAWARENLAKLDTVIQKTCWDGEWFIWAIAEDGTVFGSRNYPEGQIYLNTQAWAVISGAATPGQTAACLDAVKQRLSSEYGVALCAPPFERTPVNVMRAVLMNPGNKENGGIFSHTQSWIVLAEVLRGNGDQAYAYYRSFMPAAQNDRAEVRQIEPFAHCQSTHAPCSPKFGVSRVPWLSGTASWSYYTATQWILGIRPEIDGLRIDPCIPAAWDGYEVTRRFRGATYVIRVANPRRVCRGVPRLTVDGRTVAGAMVPVAPEGATVRVEATMG